MATFRSRTLTQCLPGTTGNAPSSMTDRVTEKKAVTCAFLAEHCLPFTMAPALISYAQKMAVDKAALSRLSMSRQHATYLLTHGIAKCFKEDLCGSLKESAGFSLNVDESTNSHMDKIMNMLVRYYNEQQGKVVTDQLASCKVNIGTAQNLFNAIDSVLSDANLPWDMLVSCLMDNCNVMRGKKGGVETLMRAQNPNLLDVSGDTVHIVSNAAKDFCRPFGNYVETVCSDIYYDIEESTKAKEILSEMATLIGIENKAKTLIRPISSRFLQMIDVTNRLSTLMDAVTVYYYSFLNAEDQDLYK